MSDSRTVGPPLGCDQSRGTAIVAHWNGPGVQDRHASVGGGGVDTEPGDEEGEELAVAVAVLVGDVASPAVGDAVGEGAATCL
jgi:hypothetical protein